MTFENIAVYNIENAIRGMRNPMNSHDKMDTHGDEVGTNDLNLAERLIKAGPPHRKFLRQIFVSVDICKAPTLWVTEFQTYKVGTPLDSASTMHRITSRDLTVDDFEKPELAGEELMIKRTIEELNLLRHSYVALRQSERTSEAEKYFRAIKRNLPASYLYERLTWTADYEVLANIWEWRHNHRLPVWHEFCEKFIEKLPYSEWITHQFGD